jgi:hypothetical protein
MTCQKEIVNVEAQGGTQAGCSLELGDLTGSEGWDGGFRNERKPLRCILRLRSPVAVGNLALCGPYC